jgi:hypothetical protein
LLQFPFSGYMFFWIFLGDDKLERIYHLSKTDFWPYFCFLYTSKLYVLTFKILVIFWFNNSWVSPTFTFNYESLQYFLPRLIIVDFFCIKTKYISSLWYFFNQWDRKILWNSLSAVIMIFWPFNNLITGRITAFCSVKLLAPLWVKLAIATSQTQNAIPF